MTIWPWTKFYYRKHSRKSARSISKCLENTNIVKNWFEEACDADTDLPIQWNIMWKGRCEIFTSDPYTVNAALSESYSNGRLEIVTTVYLITWNAKLYIFGSYR